MISFDELDLMMQQKIGATQQDKPVDHTDFLDYMNNTEKDLGNAHTNNTELKPLTNFELSNDGVGIGRRGNYDLDSEINQPYEIQDMQIDLGQGGKLPSSFTVGLRKQYELDSYGRYTG